MQILTFLTSFLVIISGVYVLHRGDWSYFQLKYAALVFSIVTGLWSVVAVVMDPHLLYCTMDEKFCFASGMYDVVRNISFVLFHLAVGRDACFVRRKGDRRSKQEKHKLREVA